MPSTSVTIRMDENLKKQVESADPFYCESNQQRLREAIADLEAGRNIVVKTMDELMAMENG